MKKEYGVALEVKGYVVFYIDAESEEEAKESAIIQLNDSEYIDNIQDIEYVQTREIWIDDDSIE